MGLNTRSSVSSMRVPVMLVRMLSPLLWAGVLAFAVSACAQDIDTEVIGHAPATRFTILDQVANPAERQAFTDLYKERDPTHKRDAAIHFANRFPASWLLGQVYEIAAKAGMESNDSETALDYGERSLRLWPENPLLLVPLANLQAQKKMLAPASRNAINALWCLDRFDRPASIDEKNWPQLQRSLRSSSYFVLGRVAAVKAFETSGQSKARYLADADRALVRAISLDRSDPEITYLEGLVQLGLDKPAPAAEYFAQTYRMRGPLAAEALQQLQTFYHREDTSRKYSSFDAFMSSLKLELLALQNTLSNKLPLPEYAGSDACGVCHPQQYASWKRTGMSRMFREYKPENVLGNFSGSQVIDDERGIPSARPVIDHGKHYFDIRQPDYHWTRFPVQFTIGSKWQQAYATKFGDGRIQVFPIQYNALQNRWINYWEMTDASGSERAQIDRFSSGVSGATYQLNCAPCHTSQLIFNEGGANPGEAAFREPGINCEMCHGPSGGHAAAMRSKNHANAVPGASPVDFKKINANDFVTICAQCHLQSGLRTPGADGAVNYSRSGTSFYHVSLSRPYVDFSRKAFYKDGRFRVTTFITESFVRSRCFREGQAHCGFCHDPHPADSASNPTSLKFPKDSDDMCLQCHAPFRAKQQSHTHHLLSSDGSRCVSCHMPKIMESLLFNARSHQIDDIPSAEMTERFGQRESPNACLLCHQDKNDQWLRQQLASWQKAGTALH